MRRRRRALLLEMRRRRRVLRLLVVRQQRRRRLLLVVLLLRLLLQQGSVQRLERSMMRRSPQRNSRRPSRRRVMGAVLLLMLLLLLLLLENNTARSSRPPRWRVHTTLLTMHRRRRPPVGRPGVYDNAARVRRPPEGVMLLLEMRVKRGGGVWRGVVGELERPSSLLLWRSLGGWMKERGRLHDTGGGDDAGSPYHRQRSAGAAASADKHTCRSRALPTRGNTTVAGAVSHRFAYAARTSLFSTLPRELVAQALLKLLLS